MIMVGWLEVQFEHAQRLLAGWPAWQWQIASGSTTSHFFTWYSIHSTVDGDVAFEEMETRVIQQALTLSENMSMPYTSSRWCR